EFFHESDGGGYRFTDSSAGTVSFVGCNDDAEPVKIELYAKDSTSNVGSRILQTLGGVYYTACKTDMTFAAGDEIATLAKIKGANYWPSNVLFYFESANPSSAFRTTSSGTTSIDGWMIAQTQLDTSNDSYFRKIGTGFTGSRYNAALYTRPTGSATPDGTISYFNRPFSWTETIPLVGKRVTFSFGLKFGTGFPQNIDGYGLKVALYGTTRLKTQEFPTVNGTFFNYPVTIIELDPILSCTTDAFTRQSFAVDIPSDVTQINFHMEHTNYQTGNAIPANYNFQIYLPAIRIGDDASEPEPPSYAEDFWGNAQRFQRITVNYNGTVNEGDVITQNVRYLIDFDFTHNNMQCMRAVDDVTPVNFSAAAINNVSAGNIRDRYFTLNRTASASGTASFTSTYTMGNPLW
ncbi:MAG: hypothetical protein LBP65_03070, partial [Puniceicoccales bacterium]|nr:hypothetical protein [Puniceicoccales bacterium]